MFQAKEAGIFSESFWKRPNFLNFVYSSFHKIQFSEKAEPSENSHIQPITTQNVISIVNVAKFQSFPVSHHYI